MKILFPIGSFYPSQMGGPCNSVYALAKGLVQAGVQASVVTTNYEVLPETGMPFDEWTVVDGIRVYYIKRPANKSISMVNALFYLKPSIVTDVLDTRCDIMHTSMLFTSLPHIAASFAKEQKMPLVWSPRGSMMSDAFKRAPLKKKIYLAMPLIRRSLRQSYFHATSPEEATDIANWMKWYTGEEVAERTTIIPNIMSDELFAPGGAMSPYPYKYVLYLGRIHPIKKLENLIEAFAKLQPPLPSPPSSRGETKLPSPLYGEGGPRAVDEVVKLVIAGWTGEVPEYTKSLKLMVEKLGLGDRVVFTEKRVEGHDKATLYRHAEVFVLPSESENFGMVVIESLAQGVPVIASNKTPWQILEKKGAGFWPANDPASLAQSLERFFSQSETERKNMKGKAAQLANEYTAPALIDRYIAMYENVLRQHRDGRVS